MEEPKLLEDPTYQTKFTHRNLFYFPLKSNMDNQVGIHTTDSMRLK